MWDYALLTETASKFGGPEKYIDTIETIAYTKGTVNGLIRGAGIVALISVPVCAAIAKAYADYRLKINEADRAKRTLSNYLKSEEQVKVDWEKHHGQI